MIEALTLQRLEALEPDAAAALLAYRQGEGAAALDAGVLAAWLERPEHAAAWARMQAAWADFDAVGDDEIVEALRDHARRAGPARPAPAAGWRRPAAAAAVALALGAGLMWGLARGPQAPSGPGAAHRPPPAAGRLYENLATVAESHVLADGSRLVLASGSAAQVAAGPTRREVALLRGRAFFDVARDTRRPFEVQAGGYQVRAVGTRFDVAVTPGWIEVVLFEGRVAVGAGEAGLPVRLEPGQRFVAQAGRRPQVGPADLEAAGAWQARQLVFENVTLAEAATQLNRYGPERLIVRDPRVAQLRISGRFRTGDLRRFGRALALLHPVRLEPRGPGTWEVVAAPR
ncbi:FecR family protein [Phenylobacterium sp.]|uniref:FecR family protein n=1 Tax=Phenylobacterium sp. TaxID=1871053 RepID=UPI0035B15D03